MLLLFQIIIIITIDRVSGVYCCKKRKLVSMPKLQGKHYLPSSTCQLYTPYHLRCKVGCPRYTYCPYFAFYPLFCQYYPLQFELFVSLYLLKLNAGLSKFSPKPIDHFAFYWSHWTSFGLN